MSNLGEPIQLPSIRLPSTSELTTPTLLIPTAEIPSYKPLVVPPSDLRSPKGVKQTTEQKEPPSLKIPVLDIPIPVPTTEVVMTATYAAVSAVAVTTLAQPLFDQIKKKLQKFLQGKIDKWKQKQQKNPKDSLES
jgi:hypothetical protein